MMEKFMTETSVILTTSTSTKALTLKALAAKVGDPNGSRSGGGNRNRAKQYPHCKNRHPNHDGCWELVEVNASSSSPTGWKSIKETSSWWFGEDRASEQNKLITGFTYLAVTDAVSSPPKQPCHCNQTTLSKATKKRLTTSWGVKKSSVTIPWTSTSRKSLIKNKTQNHGHMKHIQQGIWSRNVSEKWHWNTASEQEHLSEHSTDNNDDVTWPIEPKEDVFFQIVDAKKISSDQQTGRFPVTSCRPATETKDTQIPKIQYCNCSIPIESFWWALSDDVFITYAPLMVKEKLSKEAF